MIVALTQALRRGLRRSDEPFLADALPGIARSRMPENCMVQRVKIRAAAV